MTDLLFLNNSYQKECTAKVIGVTDGKYVTLDQTIFYAQGGGQPSDKGQLIINNITYDIIIVKKIDGQIIHEVNIEGLKVGDNVKCVLDWDRRYTLMKYHTSAHLLASILNKQTGALITGNQLDVDKVRFDFNLENFDKTILESAVEKTNSYLGTDVPLKVYALPRDKAMKIEGIIKLANALPPNIETLRIVEIIGLDIQADGGTHVNNLLEIPRIVITKMKNKGKSNRRIYYSFID